MTVKFCQVGTERSQKTPSFQMLLAFFPASKQGCEDTGSVPSPRLWKSIKHCASWTQLSSVQSPVSWVFGGNIGYDDGFWVWFPDSWFSYRGGSQSPDLHLISSLPHPSDWLVVLPFTVAPLGTCPAIPPNGFISNYFAVWKVTPVKILSGFCFSALDTI